MTMHRVSQTFCFRSPVLHPAMGTVLGNQLIPVRARYLERIPIRARPQELIAVRAGELDVMPVRAREQDTN